MMKQFLAILVFLAVLLLQTFSLQRCANPIPPSGGDRDSIPPMLVLEKTTPNLQTNFKPQQIELTFDEWVVLQNPSQIVISPPLQLEDQPRLKGKTLIIPLQGVTLQDSVTYTINLGEAVVDLNEKNPTENLRFVFATGPELDSASVRGRVVDAYTGEPKKDILVSLYANLADTAIQAEQPFYFGYTDEEGRYELEFLRPGSYRAVALENASGIYEYGSATTGIGFLDSIVEIRDTQNTIEDFRLSPLPKRLQVGVDSSEFGFLKFDFNRAATEVDFRAKRTDYIQVPDRDTLRIFYLEASNDSFFIGDDDMGLDTIYYAGTEASSLDSLGPVRVSQGPANRILPGEAMEIIFSRPIAAIDISEILLLKDTLDTGEVFLATIDTTQLNKVLIKSSWTAESSFALKLNPGAVTDIYGQSITDSLAYNVRPADLSTVGTLRLSFQGLDSTRAYVVRVVSGNNRQLITSFLISDQASFFQQIDRLPPNSYVLEIITDRNRNGRYDAGNWELQRQPENVQIAELKALRANWELDADVVLEPE